MYPADLKYTREHEWVRVEGNRGRIGLTHHAQHALGDVVFVELPKPGRRFAVANGKMETLGVVESVKAVSDVFCPLSGRSSRSTPCWRPSRSWSTRTATGRVG